MTANKPTGAQRREAAERARKELNWTALEQLVVDARHRGELDARWQSHQIAAAAGQGDFERLARSLGERLTLLAPEDIHVFRRTALQLASCWLVIGRRSEAVTLLRAAASITPPSPEAAAGLCDILDKTPDAMPPCARSHLVTLATHAPTRKERATARWHLAQRHASEGNMTDAIDEAGKAMEEDAEVVDLDELDAWLETTGSTSSDIGDVALQVLLERAQQVETEDEAMALVEALLAAVGDTHDRPDLQVRILDAVLERCPRYLRAFEEQTRCLGAMKAWPALAQAYQRMIHRVHNGGVPHRERVLGLLWKNLGELFRGYLDSPREAVHAFRMACEHDPHPAAQEALMDAIGRLKGEDLDTPSLETSLAHDPAQARSLEELGARLLKEQNRDRGVLLLRVAVATGAASPKARQLLAKHDKAPGGCLDIPYPRKARGQWMRFDPSDTVLETVFAAAFDLVGGLYEWDVDRLTPPLGALLRTQEDLLFQRVWDRLTRAWGYDTPPPVALHPGTTGLRSAHTAEPLFLLNPEVLTGWTEVELQFLVARALMLAQPRFVLTDRVDASRCHAILGAMVLAVDPDAPIEARPSVVELSRRARRSLSDTWRDPLEDAVSRVLQENHFARLERWLQHVQMEADRMGLLYADAPRAALRALERVASTEDQRALASRRTALLRWAVSPAWSGMRRELGIALS